MQGAQEKIHDPWRRFAQSYTVNFVRFLMGLRAPSTSVTLDESAMLASLATGKKNIVEVGVFEGVTSRILCQHMDRDGELLLVDPFVPTVRLERLLGISFTRCIARKAVREYAKQVRWERSFSVDAAARFPGGADFIFVDAAHDYESVRQDFIVWQTHLASGGVMAFHDSHRSSKRPELNAEVGPVRLIDEISAGQHGAWTMINHVDSLTVIRRTGELDSVNASSSTQSGILSPR